ncbi:hypothetical protein C8R47DRAFT_1064861 [Mycena vitilis]|nr:hypothetical protein C8R47DRAFT_1064861 [Mycena vitilis]
MPPLSCRTRSSSRKPHTFWLTGDLVLYMMRFLSLITLIHWSHVDSRSLAFVKKYLKGRVLRYTTPFFTKIPRSLDPPTSNPILFRRFFQTLEVAKSWIVGSVALAAMSVLSDPGCPANINIITQARQLGTWRNFLVRQSGFGIVCRGWSNGPYAMTGGLVFEFRHPNIEHYSVIITTALSSTVGSLFFSAPSTELLVAIAPYELITPVLMNVSEQQHIQCFRRNMHWDGNSLVVPPIREVNVLRHLPRFNGVTTVDASTAAWTRPCGLSCPGVWRYAQGLDGVAHIKWGGMDDLDEFDDPALVAIGRSRLTYRFGVMCRNSRCKKSPLYMAHGSDETTNSDEMTRFDNILVNRIGRKIQAQHPPFSSIFTAKLYGANTNGPCSVPVPLRLGLEVVSSPDDLDVTWWIPPGIRPDAAVVDLSSTRLKVTHWPFDCPTPLPNPFTICVALQMDPTDSTTGDDIDDINDLFASETLGCMVPLRGNVLVVKHGVGGESVTNVVPADDTLIDSIVRSRATYLSPMSAQVFENREFAQEVLSLCHFRQFVNLSHLDRFWRACAKEVFFFRAVDRIAVNLCWAPGTLWADKVRRTKQLLLLLDGENGCLVGSAVQGLLNFKAADEGKNGETRNRDLNILVNAATFPAVARLLRSEFGMTWKRMADSVRKPQGYMPDECPVPDAPCFVLPTHDEEAHGGVGMGRCGAQHRELQLWRQVAGLKGVGVYAWDAPSEEVPFEHDQTIWRIGKACFALTCAGRMDIAPRYFSVPPEVENLFVENSGFLGLVSYAHVCSQSRAVVRALLLFRCTNVVLPYIDAVDVPLLWNALNSGHGGLTGSAPLWVTQAAPDWRPRDLNAVVALGGGTAIRRFLQARGWVGRPISSRVPRVLSTRNSRSLPAYDDLPPHCDRSDAFEKAGKSPIIVTETSDRTVFRHLAGAAHTLATILLTSSSIIAIHGYECAFLLSTWRAGWDKISYHHDISEERVQRMGGRDAYFDVVQGECGKKCPGVVRRLRGGAGVGLLTWKERPTTNIESLSILGHSTETAMDELDGDALQRDAIAYDAYSGFMDERRLLSTNPKENMIMRTMHAIEHCQPPFSSIFWGLLFATSCSRPYVVPVPLDHGVSKYHTLDDLRSQSWVQPRVMGLPRFPAFMPPHCIVGGVTNFNPLRWSEEYEPGKRLVVFMTSIDPVGVLNPSFETGTFGSVHGDVLLLVEENGAIISLQWKDINYVRKVFTENKTGSDRPSELFFQQPVPQGSLSDGGPTKWASHRIAEIPCDALVAKDVGAQCATRSVTVLGLFSVSKQIPHVKRSWSCDGAASGTFVLSSVPLLEISGAPCATPAGRVKEKKNPRSRTATSAVLVGHSVKTDSRLGYSGDSLERYVRYLVNRLTGHLDAGRNVEGVNVDGLLGIPLLDVYGSNIALACAANKMSIVVHGAFDAHRCQGHRRRRASHRPGHVCEKVANGGLIQDLQRIGLMPDH